MKLLEVIASVNPAGGGVIESVFQRAGVLRDLGHTVDLASLDAPDAACVRGALLQVYALGPGRGGYRYSPGLVPWLRSNASRFDAVIINGLWNYASFGTWRGMRGSRTPYFVFPHGMLDPWFKRTYPLKHLKKWLYWPWADYRVLRDAKAVLFTCEEERRLARESFWLYKAREKVVGLGIAAPPGDAEAQKRSFLDRFPELAGKRYLLFLGRIHPKKGCDLLIKAFARVLRGEGVGRGQRAEVRSQKSEVSGQPQLPAPNSQLLAASSQLRDLHLVMAGPDQTGWVAELKALAGQLGVADRITWPGMLTGDLKWGAIRCAEAFVLPSHQENFGIAVVEAMACGVPVLISNQVNIWREIEQDGAGLVEPDTDEGTTSLLSMWLSLEPQEVETLRRNTIPAFNRRFEIHAAARSLIEVVDPTRVATAGRVAR